MVKIVFLLVLFWLIPRKAHADPTALAGSILPTILGGLMGADEPSYQQPSMDQILTPAQKALQGDLIDIGKLGANWGKKYFDEDRFNKNKASYNETMNRLQGNAPTQTTGTATPTASTGTAQPASSFTPNADMETAMKYIDNQKLSGQPFGGGMGGQQLGFDNPVVQQIAQGKITPEMIEAYKRQKQQAMDAKLLGGR